MLSRALKHECFPKFSSQFFIFISIFTALPLVMAEDSYINGSPKVELHLSEVTSDAPSIHLTKEQEKKLIRRIDRRLVTTLGILYMCSLMDRTNLAIANIAGYAYASPFALNNVDSTPVCQRTYTSTLGQDTASSSSCSSFLTSSSNHQQR